MQTISFWFGGVMVLVVLALAFGIVFTDMLSERLYGTKRIMFVVLMFAYAIYRSFRMYQFMKASRSNEND